MGSVVQRHIDSQFSNITYNITADSLPDYDSWGWDDYWSCDDWITWHKALKQKYGVDKAKDTWLTAWNKQSVDEHDYNWCKYGTVFNNYTSAQGLDVSWVLPDLIVGTNNIAHNLIGGATNASKVLKIAIPILIIGASAGALWWGYHKFIKPQK